jgi:hypothetical protein
LQVPKRDWQPPEQWEVMLPQNPLEEQQSPKGEPVQLY